MQRPTEIAPGQVLADRYRVVRVLGEGGMGVVLEAVHLELDARVAVKILRGDVALSDEAGARFLREAKAASLLRSEFVARVTDFGRIDAGPFMVMELLDGVDLERALQGGPLAIPDAVDAVIQAAAGLAEAHAAGIVHRDIKPSNLFRTHRPDGSVCVKIVDFGISKVVRLPGGEGPSSPLRAITGDARVMGTPLYMSPEQVRSARDVDERTDVWSLAAVLYELVTGEPPFLAEDVAQLIAKVLEQAPVPPDAIRSAVPPELSAVIVRALAKDRELRTASMADFASELAPFGSAEGGIAARRASLPGVRTAGPRSVLGPVSARTALAETTDAPASLGASALASTSGGEADRRAFASTRPSMIEDVVEEVVPEPAPPVHPSAPPPVASTREDRATPSRRGAWIAAVLALAAGAGVTALVVGGNGGSPPHAAAQSQETSAPADVARERPSAREQAPDVTPEHATPDRGATSGAMSAPPVLTSPAASMRPALRPTSVVTVTPTATAVLTSAPVAPTPSGRTLW